MFKDTLIILRMLYGCASVSTIEKSFKEINYTDGVDAIDAKRIAQKYLVSHVSGNHFALSTAGMHWDSSSDAVN